MPPGSTEIPTSLRRQIVAYQTREAPGTIVIDTANTQLFFVLSGNKAIRYGVGVGRDGFTWSGTQTITRKTEWPDWVPPAEMLARQPYLPRFMAGGASNPLGARACISAALCIVFTVRMRQKQLAVGFRAGASACSTRM